MDNGKYIIIESIGADCPVLFPSFLNHFDVAKGFGGSESVISAGFFAVGAEPDKKDPENISVGVWGKSQTLKNKDGKCRESRKEDERIILRLLRDQYMQGF